MNTLEIPISKTEIVTYNFTHYKTQLIDFVLHKEVTLLIHLFKDGIFSSPTNIQYKIEGDEYTKWGDDDSYIETIVQREIGKFRSSTDLKEIPLEEFDMVV